MFKGESDLAKMLYCAIMAGGRKGGCKKLPAVPSLVLKHLPTDQIKRLEILEILFMFLVRELLSQLLFVKTSLKVTRKDPLY